MIKEATGNTTLESDNSPCGYQKNKCKGLTSPSQNLVDAFLMLDGKELMTRPENIHITIRTLMRTETRG